MRYTDLTIQTQREAPNNTRTQGFALLVRTGTSRIRWAKTQFDNLALIPIREPKYFSNLD
jgi:hypothetical protein